jgi:outer membrane receptor protein involved in Fe transport
VDGFVLRDPRNNQPLTGVPLSSIQEISLMRGGFNAEYGQVRSGIVNVVTKEGSRRNYTGTFTARYSEPSRKHFDISPYDPNSMWLRPYLDPDVAFVGTANGSWDVYDQRQFPTFQGWNEVARQRNTNDNPDDDITPAAAQQLFRWQHRKEEITDQPDYDIDAGFGGPIPVIGPKLGDLRFFAAYRTKREMLVVPLTRDDYLDYDWNVKLTSDITPAMKLNIIGVLGKSYNVAINGLEQDSTSFADYIRTPFEIAEQVSNFPFTTSSRIFSNSYYSLAEVKHRGISADFTHVLGANTFYDFGLSYFERKYNTNHGAFRDKTTFELIPGTGIFVDEAPFGWDSLAVAGIGDGILFGGHTGTTRDRSKTSYIRAKFDLTSQVNFNNQIKTGFEFVYNTLDLDYKIETPSFREGDVSVVKKWNPFMAAVYLQDKIEFKSLVANIGLRLDYSNANAEWVRTGRFDGDFFSGETDGSDKEQSAEAKLSLSPRLGISHPITDKSKLFFNYGHFKQLPTYEQIFDISRHRGGQIERFGDPNLDFAKTVSYELGYDHELFDNYLIQLAGFYHDISDQVTYVQRRSRDGRVNTGVATNDSYEDIRALEVTLRKARGRWWTGFITYTYQVNTAGRFGRDVEDENPVRQREFDRNIQNFAQNRPKPQPRANLVLTFRTPGDFGPEILGSKILGNWSAAFLGTYRAGSYETWNPNLVRGVSQNLQRTSFYNLDLRLTKKFDFGRFSTTFLMDVTNVFNTRNFSFASFYNNFDRLDYFNSLHLPRSSAYNNIVGDDHPGDFRKPGVAFQPIEQVANVNSLTNPLTRPFYFETSTGRYMQFVNGVWQEVPRDVLNRVLDNKAYIDMPNQTSFTFLNPRNIFVGITTSFEF